MFRNLLRCFTCGDKEGTWTPVLTFGGTTTGINYTLQIGEWTRIGRLVFCTFDFAFSSKGSSVGIALLTGLPFTASGKSTSIDSGYSAGNLGSVLNLSTAVVEVNLMVIANSKTCSFPARTAASTGNSAMDDTFFSDSTQIIGSFCYHTNDR